MYVILFKSIQKDIQIQKRDPLVILQMYKNPI